MAASVHRRLGECHRQAGKSCSVFRVVREVSCVQRCAREICLRCGVCLESVSCVSRRCPSFFFMFFIVSCFARFLHVSHFLLFFCLIVFRCHALSRGSFGFVFHSPNLLISHLACLTGSCKLPKCRSQFRTEPGSVSVGATNPHRKEMSHTEQVCRQVLHAGPGASLAAVSSSAVILRLASPCGQSDSATTPQRALLFVQSGFAAASQSASP